MSDGKIPVANIPVFRRGEMPTEDQMEMLREQSHATAVAVNELSTPGNQTRLSAYVKITAAMAGVPWYTGRAATGEVRDDGSTDMDLANSLTFPPFDDVLIFNIAEIGGTHSLEAGDILRGFYAGRTPDGEMSVVEVNPGGGGGESQTNGTVTGQVWQTVSENVNAHQLPLAHATP